jgi:polyisoprenoid-binding protein YceI
MLLTIFCFLTSVLFPAATWAQAPEGVPVFEITPVESKIKFDVEASVAIEGTFDKWDASMTFAATDISTGVLDTKIQADNVDTGSGMKNRKDFFDAQENPLITFKSTKVTQTGPDTIDVQGVFTTWSV